MHKNQNVVRNLQDVCTFSELPPFCYNTWSAARHRASWLTTAERNPGSSLADLFPDFPAQLARDFLQTMREFKNNKCGSSVIYLGTAGDETEPFPGSWPPHRPSKRLRKKEWGHPADTCLTPGQSFLSEDSVKPKKQDENHLSCQRSFYT